LADSTTVEVEWKMLKVFIIPDYAPERIRGRKIFFYGIDSLRVEPAVVEPTEEEVQFIIEFVSEKIDDASGKNKPPEEDGGSRA
jgi:hypothetical protein